MKDSLKILIVDDEQDHRETFRMILEAKGYQVGEAASGKEALDLLDKEYFPIVLSDIMMVGMSGLELLDEVMKLYKGRIEMIMVTGYGSVETAVKALKNGAFGYFIKTRSPDELLIEIEKAHKFLNLQAQNAFLKQNQGSSRFLLQSKNRKMQDILDVAQTVAKSKSNVLLLGESGVGKEVIAQMIHKSSERADMPFVAINCQFFSESLMESELFGHEKGAFTGAMGKRIGRFEEASGGTVFLDEIGEMALSTQVKLLRVLENRKIERIGSNKEISVDFRLISATNKNLKQAIRESAFREDLNYRINTITLEIPPLRDRSEDIPDMIDFFMSLYSAELKKNLIGMDESTRKYLLNYDYPGNIRELKNMIERMAVLTSDGYLRMENNSERTKPILAARQTGDRGSYKDAKREFETSYIRNVLEQTENNITKAAEIMEISRRQLFNKLVELNLRPNIE